MACLESGLPSEGDFERDGDSSPTMLRWSRVLIASVLRAVIAQSTLNVADPSFGSLRFAFFSGDVFELVSLLENDFE